MFYALNILVVEDYHPLQHSLIEVLKKLGHHARTDEAKAAASERMKAYWASKRAAVTP